MSGVNPRVSVVIPMLNEAGNVAALFSRLFPVLESLGETFEVIAIDDGSTDETLRLLRAEQKARPRLRALSLARNFGQHAAVLAGFEASRGAWVITMDADLQNPPEEIPKVVARLREGYDVVNTVRMGPRGTLFRRTASRITNALVRRCSGISLGDFGCMLRGYDREVVEAMTGSRELRTFIPALAMLHARRPVEILVEHSARGEGRSSYSLLKLFSLQMDLVASFSMAPLRALIMLGWVVAACGLAFAALLLVLRIAMGAQWAGEGVFTLFAVLFIFIGAQFVAFGLLGEYIGRIYEQVRSRPTYLLRKDESDAEEAGP